eukprot:1244496-Lingulodinium_polyedra.AAC.1
MLGSEHWAVADGAGLPSLLAARSGRGLPAGAIEQYLVNAMGIGRLEDQTSGPPAEMGVGSQVIEGE